MSTQLATTPTAESVRVERKTATIRGHKAVGAVSHTLLSIWAAVVILPLLWTVLSSFKTASEIFASPFSLPAHWSFINYVHAWSQSDIGSYFLNPVLVVGCALIIVMVLGAMCAYVLARHVFPGSKAISYLMLAGAGEWRTFFQVMLPMAKPGLASVAVFNFLGLWNQYLIPVAINATPSHNVLSQGLGAFASQMGYSIDFGALFAAVVITVVPVLVVYIIFQRQLQGSVSAGTMK